MSAKSVILLAGACLLLFPSAGNSQSAVAGGTTLETAHFPSNEQLRHFRTVRNPKLSPDGRSVVAVIADATADGGKTHLWLIDVIGGAPRQLTYSPDADKSGERAPTWMPDGQSILFLAHRGEHTSLFRLPMQGGEAKAFDLKVVPAADTSKRSDAIPLDAIKKEDAKTTAATAASQGSKTPEKKADDKPDAGAAPDPVAVDVSSYAVAPDGRTIALIIDDPQTPGEKRQMDAKADAEWVDHNPHAARLYLMDPATGKLTNTAAPADVREVAWAPDADRLLVISEAPNGVGDLQPANTFSVLAATSPAKPEVLAQIPATVGAAQWSRDGERIVYLAQAKRDAPPGVSDLYEYTLATKATVDRSADLKGNLAGDPIARPGNETVVPVELGTEVAFAEFPSGTAAPQMMRGPVAVVSSLGTNEKQTGWVFLGSDSSHAPALYFASELSATHEVVSARPLKLPDLRPDNLPVVASRRVHWKNDRLDVEGLLFMPPVTGGQKVPLIVEVHGGPTGAFNDRYDPFVLFLLGKGWAVFRPNPRGSTGYGTSFAAANKNDLGGGDFRDIMAGVDSLLKAEPIDVDRMALIGYSYGGEMAGFAESRTDRFRAIVSAAPVIDQFSEYGTESGSFYDRWFYGYPWEHHEDAWRQSPLAGVGHARTPFLLIQGESDTTDPLGQAQEMYRALRQAKVPVELITYPRENHGPLANGIYGGSSTEPWHGYDARQRIVTFIEQAFKNGATH